MDLTILLVEPEQKLREVVRLALNREGHRVLAFARADGAIQALQGGGLEPALALITSGPDPSVEPLVEVLGSLSATCQKVWIAPAGETEVDRLAASRKPRGLLSRSGLEDEARILADRVRESRERGRLLAGIPHMLGDSPVMEEIRDLIERIASGGATNVLVTGESGTGKEVAARRLHALGPRAHAPFVEVDCASIPNNLLESELFGHEAGAFTDARTAKTGLMELGQGGTVFLDEIGELDLGLQAKLLRVLDSRRLRRLGGRVEIPLDIHLVAATNRDLLAEVRTGAFRTDLYYRLDVVRVELPPVRERGDDAWQLTGAFLEEAARRMGRPVPRLAPRLRREILSYPWPGNVREIRNHMERLVLLGNSAGGVIEELALPSGGRARCGGVSIDFSGGPVSWESIERIALTEALVAADGNISEAARLLGLGRGALRYRLSRHDLDEFKGDRQKAA